MKKWLIAILVLFLLLVVFTYIFIPNVISVNQSVSIHVTPQGLQRNLFDEKKLDKMVAGKQWNTG